MANQWAIFKELISTNKKWIGKVITTNTSTKKVEVLPIGSTSSLYVDSNGSDYLSDSYVFVDSGIITGQAPQIAAAYKEIIS